MDYSQKPVKKNPRKGANLLSQLFFLWLLPLMFRVSSLSPTLVCCSSHCWRLFEWRLRIALEEGMWEREIMTAWTREARWWAFSSFTAGPLSPPPRMGRLHNFIKLIIPFSSEKFLILFSSLSLSRSRHLAGLLSWTETWRLIKMPQEGSIGGAGR